MGTMDLGTLNVVDIAILVIFFVSILIGFGRGFISEALSLLTLIAAFVVAIMFTNTLAAYFTSTTMVQEVVNSTTTAVGTSTAQPISYMALGISFGILFAATVIVGGIIKALLNLMFQRGILGFGNRIFGGIFGFFRGYLINLVLIFLVQLSPLASQPWWQHSQYVPKFQPQVVWLGNIVSPALSDLKSTFAPAIQEVTDSVKNMTNSTSQ
ncbi:MAG: CvpA family protein [Gammaproteobacteria bacterium]|nr:CvpA family protein [Gammaproteobacteria bacterium]MCW5583078.1 CvpA family protein [Gammaproteobacteria bacterium]